MVAPSCVELEVTAAYEPVSEVLLRRIRFRVLGVHIYLFRRSACRSAGGSCMPGNIFCWNSRLKMFVTDFVDRYSLAPLDAGKEEPEEGQSSPFSLILAAGYVVKALTEIFSKVFLVYTDPACSGSPSFVVVTVLSFDIKSWW